MHKTTFLHNNQQDSVIKLSFKTYQLTFNKKYSLSDHSIHDLNQSNSGKYSKQFPNSLRNKSHIGYCLKLGHTS